MNRAIAVLVAALLAVGAAPVTAQDPAPTTLPGPTASVPTEAGASLPPAPVLPAPDLAPLPAGDPATEAQLPVADLHAAPEGEVDLGAMIADADATLDRMPASHWSRAAIAEALDYDPWRAFALVRDRIGYEPYPGVLRGADGTLAARAGSAPDRALLLKALLDDMGAVTRFARGTLDDATATRLVERTFGGVTDPLQDGGAAALAALDTGAIRQRATRDRARLLAALGDRVDGMRATLPRDLAASVRDHVWVQMLWGAQWLNLDPSLPDAQPGDALTTATQTLPALPADLVAGVRLRVLAESLSGSTLAELVVLDRTIAAPDLEGRRVYLYFQPQLEGIGGSITEALSGVSSWLPVLLIDDVGTTGFPFTAGGRGTDLFGDATGAPELTRLALEVTTRAGDGTERTAQHLLLDRVPADLRAGGTIDDPAALAPLAMDGGAPVVMGRMLHVLISTGAASPPMATLRRAAAAGFLGRMLDEGDDAVGRHSLADMLYPMAVADEALVLGSEQLAVRSLADPSHVAAWVGEPRVFIVTVGQDPADLDALDLGTDLLLDGVHVLAATEGDASSAAQRSLWYGALEAALETEHLLGRLATLPEPPLLDGASLAMARADLVVTDDPDGTLRVTPGDPATSTTWWSVDPATGATRAVLAPGMGGVNGKVAWGKIKHQPPRINRGGAGGANTHGLTKDGRIVRLRDPGDPSPAGPPPSRCGAGQEYVAIVGCVSVPAAWAIRVGVGMAVTLGAYLASLALQSAMQDAAGP